MYDGEDEARTLKKSFPNPLTKPLKSGKMITEQRKENLTNQKGLPL
jgi:hypothetical protein